MTSTIDHSQHYSSVTALAKSNASDEYVVGDVLPPVAPKQHYAAFNNAEIGQQYDAGGLPASAFHSARL